MQRLTDWLSSSSDEEDDNETNSSSDSSFAGSRLLAVMGRIANLMGTRYSRRGRYHTHQRANGRFSHPPTVDILISSSTAVLVTSSRLFTTLPWLNKVCPSQRREHPHHRRSVTRQKTRKHNNNTQIILWTTRDEKKNNPKSPTTKKKKRLQLLFGILALLTHDGSNDPTKKHGRRR